MIIQIYCIQLLNKFLLELSVLLDLPGSLSGVGIANSSLIEDSSARSASNQPMLLSVSV